MAALIHDDLVTQAPVAIEQPPPPKPPPPEPEPEPEPAPRHQPQVRHQPETPPAPATPPGKVSPPAEAGRIIATEADAPGPVDLTDNTFVTGTASAYVGGVSANTGSNRRPVPSTGATDRKAPPTATPGRSSRARAVQLSGGEWRCAWPASAVTEEIYEQFVVLRVVVTTEGTVERATVVRDPGHGFGKAALACARRTRFTPARNASGAPIRATSPPIRVRFTR